MSSLRRATIARSIILLFGLLCSCITSSAQTSFSFIAIGDAGQAGPVLNGNAKAMLSWTERLASERKNVGLLLFLGDNFYPIGLNRTAPARKKLIEEIIGPHRELMQKLGRENVRAMSGNHDYFCDMLGPIPHGTCNTGNQYEKSIPEWTYDYYYPALVRRAIANGSADSVDFIIFDSSYLLVHPQELWRPILDSLENMLRSSARSRGVKWRIYNAHHSPYSVGEHGGYRRWSKKSRKVEYIGNCFEDKQDPFKYAEEVVSNQDNCTDIYRAYSDSLMSIFERSGARVQVMMAGHDHSLQFLNYPDSTCAICPKVFVVSGAGAKRSKVKRSNPPTEFTHPINTPDEQGRSAGGFVIGTFDKGDLKLTFIDSETGEVLLMGGMIEFTVNVDGEFTGATGTESKVRRRE